MRKILCDSDIGAGRNVVGRNCPTLGAPSPVPPGGSRTPRCGRATAETRDSPLPDTTAQEVNMAPAAQASTMKTPNNLTLMIERRRAPLDVS